MPESIRIGLFLVVVFLANIMQTVTGFAGTVLAMPFSVILMGSEFSRTVLNILGLLASLGVVILYRKSINWKEIIKICVIMLVGMVGGYLILDLVDISKQILLLILAGFVLLFTGIGCYTTFVKKDGLQETMPQPELNQDSLNLEETHNDEVFTKKPSIVSEVFLYLLLIVAGVVHGMYVCGGPLLIIYATKKFKEKNEFRSTLSMSWVVLNGVNLVRDIITKNITVIGTSIETIAAAVMSLMMLGSAIAIGTIIAKRLNKQKFMIITYVLMGISGISLILNAFGVF